MNKLIYFTLGNNPKYIDLAKICIDSLYKNKYDGDILFITNYKEHILKKVEFKSPVYFLEMSSDNLLESSSNKLKIYQWYKIREYDKIIFSDIDIIFLDNLDIIFDLIIDDKFYMSKEKASMAANHFGGLIFDYSEKNKIINDNTKGLNAGFIGFNIKMIEHLEGIYNFMDQNRNLIESCLEQPFVNAYVYRNNIYEILSDTLVTSDGNNIDSYNGVVVHFAGGGLGYCPYTKYEKMNKFNYQLL